MRRGTRARPWMIMQTALLGVLVWMLAASHSTLTQAASAKASGMDIPDAASQRIEMIKELHKLNDAMTDMRKDMEKMEFKVKVTSMPASAAASATGTTSGANSDGSK